VGRELGCENGAYSFIICVMRTWIACLLVLAVFASDAHGVVLSRLYDFQSGTPAESDQVNAELDNILSGINGNLNSDNFLDGGIATADIATASVTQIKLGAKGEQISASSDLVQRSATSEALVPNMVNNITVVSRPVFVGLQSAGGSSAPGRVSYRHNGGGATDNAAYVSFQRDVATVNQVAIGARSITNSTDDIFISLPCSAFSFIDVPSVGPHNYAAAFRVATGDSGIISVENCKLVVFEL